MREARGGSRRSRQLWLTVGLLIAAAAAGLLIGWRSLRESAPTAYRPGEKVEGVTSRLSHRVPAEAPPIRFTDVTAAAGITFRSFQGPRSSQLPEDMGSGAAWGDYDNDGDDDLFLVSAGGSLALSPEERAPCELYENRGDGTFRLDESFPETRIIGMGAAWGDYDGDGWLDLVVTGFDSLLLFRNEGGTLRRAAFPSPPGFWAGPSWGDYDNDRDLDLYVCGYVRYRREAGGGETTSRQYGKEVPFTLNPSSYRPERNLLFRNDGGGRFTEVAAELGVDNVKGRSLSALWSDFDEDGRLDLYVANDISDNVLFMNREDKFEDASHRAWVADYRGAMGLASGDWNGDGDEDIFVTHWIAQENALYDSLLVDLAGGREAGRESRREPSAPGRDEGEEVYAGIRFMDVGSMVGLGQPALPVIGWGAAFGDLDSDGWLDLVVSNGSTFETEEDPPGLRRHSLFLFWNNRGRTFHNLAPLHPPLDSPLVGRGLALSDYDRDGDLDFVVVAHGEGVRRYRNDMATGNRVVVSLAGRGADGAVSSRGEGARLTARAGGRTLIRTVGATTYLSQSSLDVHFGLGAAERIDSLEIRWPGGKVQRHAHLDANTRWRITEGEDEPQPLGPLGAETAGGAVDRQAVVDFWELQRAAVRAMRVDGDAGRAVDLFQKALALKPGHEDSLYYLGLALDEQGKVDQALAVFEKLAAVNPSSHRAYRQVGLLRARHATGRADLDAAAAAFDRALAINSEETGVLLLRGEVDLLRGEFDEARRNFAWVVRTNPRAAVSFYLLGYLSWKGGDGAGAAAHLSRAVQAGEGKSAPAGSTAEGDVRAKMYTDQSILSDFYDGWGGDGDPGRAFGRLDAFLAGKGVP